MNKKRNINNSRRYLYGPNSIIDFWYETERRLDAGAVYRDTIMAMWNTRLLQSPNMYHLLCSVVLAYHNAGVLNTLSTNVLVWKHLACAEIHLGITNELSSTIFVEHRSDFEQPTAGGNCEYTGKQRHVVTTPYSISNSLMDCSALNDIPK